MTDRARIILESLLKRLAGKSFEANDVLYHRGGPGPVLIKEAVAMARRALASGDAAQMDAAAVYCQNYEIIGNEEERQFGGNKLGAERTAEAQRKWGPVIVKYEALLAQGVEYKQARKDATKGIIAGERSIRGWLPKPGEKSARS